MPLCINFFALTHIVDTVGKRLSQARMQKKISIEQAARITRIRPERIVDLENDDYSNFPSTTYTKGFLQIYAKFLGVDVSNFTETFADVSPIGIDDYEYLNNAPVSKPAMEARPTGESSSRPFVIALAGIVIVAFIFYVVNSIERLGSLDKLAEKDEPREGISTLSKQAATTTAAVPVARAIAVTTPERTPVRAAPQQTAAPAPNAETKPAPSAAPAAAPLTAPSAQPVLAGNEVILKPLKKTWVIIHKDGENSESIFEDWLYPDAQPLILHGRNRYWIQLGDKDGVQIQRNGQTIAYQSPGLTIE